MGCRLETEADTNSRPFQCCGLPHRRGSNLWGSGASAVGARPRAFGGSSRRNPAGPPRCGLLFRASNAWGAGDLRSALAGGLRGVALGAAGRPGIRDGSSTPRCRAWPPGVRAAYSLGPPQDFPWRLRVIPDLPRRGRRWPGALGLGTSPTFGGSMGRGCFGGVRCQAPTGATSSPRAMDWFRVPVGAPLPCSPLIASLTAE